MVKDLTMLKALVVVLSAELVNSARGTGNENQEDVIFNTILSLSCRFDMAW